MDRRIGTAFSLASGAAFGAMAIFGKLAYDEGVNVATLLTSRFILGAILFWALWLAISARRSRTFPTYRSIKCAIGASRRDLFTGLGLGAFGYSVQAGCYFAALERIDASLLSLLLYTFPTIVAIAAAALGRDRLDAPKLIALVLASGGLVLVLSGAGPGALDPVGVALALAAAFVYSAYILVSEGVASRVRPELLSALVCTGAAMTLLPATVLIGKFEPGNVTAAGWGWLLCLVAVSTVAAISFFFAGLRRVGPTAASILATVEPVVTVSLAALVFGESLGVSQIFGAALVLTAVPVLALGRSRLEPGGVASDEAGGTAHRTSPAGAPA